MKTILVISCIAIIAGVPGYGQSVPVTTADPSEAQNQKAVIDQYCVTCHSDNLKTANLTLENADFSDVANNAELWETVIRKLRAGVMPPAGIRRPPVEEYAALRDWLENEIDSNAAGRSESRIHRYAPHEPGRIRQCRPRPH